MAGKFYHSVFHLSTTTIVDFRNGCGPNPVTLTDVDRQNCGGTFQISYPKIYTEAWHTEASLRWRRDLFNLWSPVHHISDVPVRGKHSCQPPMKTCTSEYSVWGKTREFVWYERESYLWGDSSRTWRCIVNTFCRFVLSGRICQEKQDTTYRSMANAWDDKRACVSSFSFRTTRILLGMNIRAR